MVEELLERLDIVFLRLINRGEPTGHRLDALAVAGQQQASAVVA